MRLARESFDDPVPRTVRVSVESIVRRFGPVFGDRPNSMQ